MSWLTPSTVTPASLKRPPVLLRAAPPWRSRTTLSKRASSRCRIRSQRGRPRGSALRRRVLPLSHRLTPTTKTWFSMALEMRRALQKGVLGLPRRRDEEDLVRPKKAGRQFRNSASKHIMTPQEALPYQKNRDTPGRGYWVRPGRDRDGPCRSGRRLSFGRKQGIDSSARQPSTGPGGPGLSRSRSRRPPRPWTTRGLFSSMRTGAPGEGRRRSTVRANQHVTAVPPRRGPVRARTLRSAASSRITSLKGPPSIVPCSSPQC